MTNPKRVKSVGKSSKQHMTAKHAVKKKAKSAAKFHNEQLRMILDNRTSILYSMNQVPQKTIESPSDSFKVDIQDLTSTLGNL
ncbi:hypothetical protein H2248_005388 [Termitomyces sp. 'cryptogamus']|nr:hypothetical protein H2248_005388 [Termitomyces sp. 'cryptogamus']